MPTDMYSVVKHGKRGWFWVAWPARCGNYYEAFCAEGVEVIPPYEGYDTTELDAHNAARAVLELPPHLGPIRGVGTRRVRGDSSSHYAAGILKRRALKARMQRPSAPIPTPGAVMTPSWLLGKCITRRGDWSPRRLSAQ